MGLFHAGVSAATYLLVIHIRSCLDKTYVALRKYDSGLYHRTSRVLNTTQAVSMFLVFFFFLRGGGQAADDFSFPEIIYTLQLPQSLG